MNAMLPIGQRTKDTIQLSPEGEGNNGGYIPRRFFLAEEHWIQGWRNAVAVVRYSTIITIIIIIMMIITIIIMAITLFFFSITTSNGRF